MLRKVSDDATKEGYILIKYIVQGGTKLSGSVTISGAKNAAVAILPATLLVSGPCRIENVPDISDVRLLLEILRDMGAEIHRYGRNTLEIDCSRARNATAPIELVRRIRASYYLIGAELGRFGHAHVAMPGGCNFGVRPIDQHIKGFKALGADVDIDCGVVHAKAEKLTGAHVYFDVVTVGATINLMMASCMAEGDTILENAAKEPHIVDVANFLNSMGANIKGAGTDVIRIKGVKRLHGCTYSIIPDQIEAGTFMMAAAATHGDVVIQDIIPKHMESISAKLIEMGCRIEEGDDSLRVIAEGCTLRSTNVKTLPYPGFPTDMQPQISVVLALAEGSSMVTESIFENRFKYVDELGRMGAKIKVEGNTAYIEGVKSFCGVQLNAPDLRAGAALVIAALAADGISEIDDIEYIQRGYEDFEGKITNLGGIIKRVDSERELQKFRLKIG